MEQGTGENDPPDRTREGALTIKSAKRSKTEINDDSIMSESTQSSDDIEDSQEVVPETIDMDVENSARKNWDEERFVSEAQGLGKSQQAAAERNNEGRVIQIGGKSYGLVELNGPTNAVMGSSTKLAPQPTKGKGHFSRPLLLEGPKELAGGKNRMENELRASGSGKGSLKTAQRVHSLVIGSIGESHGGQRVAENGKAGNEKIVRYDDLRKEVERNRENMQVESQRNPKRQSKKGTMPEAVMAEVGMEGNKDTETSLASDEVSRPKPPDP